MASQIKKYFSRFSLQWRGLTLQLFAVTVLPLTILLLVITFGSFSLHQQAMRSMVGDRDERAVKTAAKAFESEIDHRILGVQTVDLRASSVQLGALGEILSSSTYLLHDFDGGLAVYHRHGTLIASIGDSAFWNSPSQKEETALKRAITQSGSTLVVSDVFPHPVSGIPMVLIVASTPSKDWVTVGAFSPQVLARQTLADAFPANNQSVVYLLDANSQPLYQSGSLSPGGNPCDHPDIVLSCQNKGGISYIRVGKNEHVVAYSSIAPVGWGLVTEESWEAVTSPTLRNTQIAPLVLVPVLLITLAALWFEARQVVQPLQKLESKAARLAWGDFEAIEQPVGGIAEIRHLHAELVHMAHKVQAAQKSLHSYIGAITAGQEEERRRLARDLHDDTIQALIALKQRAQLAHLTVRDGPEAKSLEELETLTEQAIENLRRLIRALRPIYLEDLGLVAALEMLAHEIGQANNLAVDFKLTGTERRLKPAVELALYRLAQEALSNVVHHAQASLVALNINYSNQSVCLEVSDNGVGFAVPKSPAEFASNGHYGLLGMQERAELIGATLNIHSGPERGTKMTVDMLLDSQTS
jgi:signal transduction histidine kinase